MRKGRNTFFGVEFVGCAENSPSVLPRMDEENRKNNIFIFTLFYVYEIIILFPKLMSSRIYIVIHSLAKIGLKR